MPTTTTPRPPTSSSPEMPGDYDGNRLPIAQSNQEASSISADLDGAEAETQSHDQAYAFGGSSQMQMKRSLTQMSHLLDELLIVDLVQAIQWPEWDHRGAQTGDDSAFFGMEELGGLGVGAGLASVGYVFWALRGGLLLTTIFGSVPAWRMIDPSALLSVYRDAEGTRKSKADISTFLD